MDRCFGTKNFIIRHHKFEEISNMKRIEDSNLKISILDDILIKLINNDKIYSNLNKIMIDIKFVNDLLIIDKLFELFEKLKPNDKKFWESKIIIGVWTIPFLHKLNHYKNDWKIDIVVITHSLIYARKFLDYGLKDNSNVKGASLLYNGLWGSRGYHFIKESKQKGLQVHSWTVNDPNVMYWMIKVGLDSVITDRPDILSSMVEKIDDDYENDPVKRLVPFKFETWTQVFEYWGYRLRELTILYKYWREGFFNYANVDYKKFELVL